MQYSTRPGKRYPHGATLEADGVNFSIFSRHATRVELLLFPSVDSPEPCQIIMLDPEVNRTFYIWHVFVEGLPVGTAYAWRMDGPGDTQHSGLRFDAQKVLLDPGAKAVYDGRWDRARACRPGDNVSSSMRALVVDDRYDWEGDRPLAVPPTEAIIYELHVGGFTRHPSSGVRHPGTFHGLIEKVPYLQSLGITHVELMPIMAFDEQDVPAETAALGLRNYWGYSTHSFHSPHPRYCVTPQLATHPNEFRDLVKALHRAGIGVILDVVFNHTAEGNEQGPVINFKGIDNAVFYQFSAEDRRYYRDYTGCGNTVNCNHPMVSNFILNCLERWVEEFHVDGFRFDLASAMARGEDGAPMPNPPLLWAIELSDDLARTGLIAEAWDAAGLYQVGSFPGYRWMEWNGRYRDVLRRCLRGEGGLIGELATRLCGSEDLYRWQNRLPTNSVNFITCHDGFTLIDLFSYEHKHNEANGEQNRDGANDNFSCNCGVEGDTDDPQVLTLRRQLAKNAYTLLLLSQGVPMLLGGDEVLNTQHGNNNAYCQDNETAWFDWRLVERNADMLRFVRHMIALRRRHPALRRRRFLTGRPVPGRALPDVSWHGEGLEPPDWHDSHARRLAFTLAAQEPREADLHVIVNLADSATQRPLPEVPGRRWQLAVDTAAGLPGDIVPPHRQQVLPPGALNVAPRSVVVLEAWPGD